MATLWAGAAGAAPKVDVCHYDADADAFHLINISQDAFDKHIDHGDAVPGMEGYVFGEGCVLDLAAVDSASGAVEVSPDRFLQFDTDLGTVSWQAPGDKTFEAVVASFSVSGNTATIYGEVTANSPARRPGLRRHARLPTP